MIGLAALIGARRTALVGIFITIFLTVWLFAHRGNRAPPIELFVSSFGFILSISVISGCWLIARTATRNGIGPSDAVQTLCFGLLGGFLGARLGYVAINSGGWALWRDTFDYGLGGLFGYGAYVGGLVGVGIATRKNFFAFRIWLDRATPTLLLCTGLTRLGCYFQGCDFGRPLGAKAPIIISVLGTFPRWSQTPDGAYSGSPAWLQHVSNFGLSTGAAASLPTHPTQLYEALFAWCAALLAYFIHKSSQFPGRTFLVMAMIYGLGRFLLEFLRGDPERGILPFAHNSPAGVVGSWSQVIALSSVIAALVVWRHWSLGESMWGATRQSPFRRPGWWD